MRHTTHFIIAKIVVFSIVWQYYNIFLYFCTAKLRKECNLLEMSVG